MEEKLIVEKFGNKYLVNSDTYHMGIHYVLGDAIAKRFIGYKICLDSCLGAGFMTLMLVKYIDKIIGIDVNGNHIKQARENSRIAGVESRISFIKADALNIIDSIYFDSAFLDPDWAKIGDDKENHVLELSQMVPPADVLLYKVFQKTPNACLRLPKSFNLEKLNNLPPHESEAIYQNDILKFYCIYFGDLIRKIGNTELRL